MMIVAMLIALTACDSKKERLQDSDESHHYLYFKDSSKNDHATAIFFNSNSAESEEVEMTACSEDSNSHEGICF